mmetsp:Transcript_95537/g.139542  ORF Transcript_95537/g.139542 Transcript_95537/m.139542 type:complete len:296 (-) Transcript_95537:250-1137(-)
MAGGNNRSSENSSSRSFTESWELVWISQPSHVSTRCSRNKDLLWRRYQKTAAQARTVHPAIAATTATIMRKSMVDASASSRASNSSSRGRGVPAANTSIRISAASGKPAFRSALFTVVSVSRFCTVSGYFVRTCVTTLRAFDWRRATAVLPTMTSVMDMTFTSPGLTPAVRAMLCINRSCCARNCCFETDSCSSIEIVGVGSSSGRGGGRLFSGASCRHCEMLVAEESREKPALQRQAQEPELVKTLCVALALSAQLAHSVLLCRVHTATCSWPTPHIEHTWQRESRSGVHALAY